ncbi:uncharacterized protein [Musca autumnalis]|uniref:uncharacterized protein n=1 Tax=Musca autumnalis TaxID=221902 RepID=UPI003CF81E7B
MPSIYAGLHLPNKPDEFLTLDDVDLDKNVLHLKQQIAEKCKFQAEKLEVIYDGLALTDEEKLSETLKPVGDNTIHTVHCFQKTKKYTPYVPSEKLKDAVDTAQSLFYTIGNIQINVSCRVNILQKILQEYPEFRRNSAALALIRDSVLFNTLHQPEVIKKIAEHYPIIIEAAPFIVSTVRKELARNGSSSKFSEPATDSTNSSEEENSVGSNERGSRDDEGGSSGGRSQSENARIRMISRQQLQAALAQIDVGSANSLSNIAQRNSETSVAASASETTSTPLSSLASGERISADVLRNELQRALDTLVQPMDTTEQQAVNTSVTDDGDIPAALRTHPYAEQLRTMQQMGFLNHEENLNFLNLANGNIEQAVNLLMAAMM